MTSNDKLFVFDENQYPLYPRIRDEFWAINGRESKRQQSDSPPAAETEPTLPDHIKVEIDAMVASALKRMSAH